MLLSSVLTLFYEGDHGVGKTTSGIKNSYGPPSGAGNNWVQVLQEREQLDMYSGNWRHGTPRKGTTGHVKSWNGRLGPPRKETTGKWTCSQGTGGMVLLEREQLNM